MTTLSPELRRLIYSLPPERRSKNLDEIKVLLRVEIIKAEAKVAAFKEIEANVSAFVARVAELARRRPHETAAEFVDILGDPEIKAPASRLPRPPLTNSD